MTAGIGKGLLFLACLWLGLERSRRRKKRTACLRAFRQAVADLGRDMGFSLEPLDRLVERLSGQGGAVASFFAACEAEFARSGRESWAEAWDRALAQSRLPLQETDRVLLARVGEILGRWDGETQQRALGECLARLDERIFDGAQEEQRLFRVDMALGVTAGLFCVLLL